MSTAEERIERLENVMIELAEAQMRTNVSLKKLSDEMQDFKEEARADRKQMNKQWG